MQRKKKRCAGIELAVDGMIQAELYGWVVEAPLPTLDTEHAVLWWDLITCSS